MKGTGEIGKSVILAVITALFRPGTVGNLGSKREEVFGMDNIADKELVIGRDMPKKLSGVLPQETLQCMVSGEDMEIARKNAKAVNLTWTAPIVLTSNHFTDYESTGGNTARRFVTFCFNNPVSNPDYALKARILDSELPNILARSLKCYRELRERLRIQGIPFWSAVPDQVLEWKNSMTAATNDLHRFLAMDDDERGCRISLQEGKINMDSGPRGRHGGCVRPQNIQKRRGRPRFVRILVQPRRKATKRAQEVQAAFQEGMLLGVLEGKQSDQGHRVRYGTHQVITSNHKE